jgi:hypothetical protein
MQPFAVLQIEWRAGVVRDADTECEICVGAYFPGHKSWQVGVTGLTPHLPRVTVPFNRWLRMVGQ